ncbi:MAG: hypothetical protein IJ880_00225 [Bacilli bacterium]|nr:hypothetical protein [Bacilli bacterium]
MGLVHNTNISKTEYLVDLENNGKAKQTALLSMSSTAPSGTFQKGSQYFNSTDKKIYTAIEDNVWGTTGKDPNFGVIYQCDNEYYVWDGDNLITTDLEGYEKLVNKATNFNTVNNTKYPTTKAVTDYVIKESIVRNFTDAGITKITSSDVFSDRTNNTGLAEEILAKQFPTGTTLYGEVRNQGMPTGIGNAEIRVEILETKSNGAQVIEFTLFSVDIEPKEWSHIYFSARTEQQNPWVWIPKAVPTNDYTSDATTTVPTSKALSDGLALKQDISNISNDYNESSENKYPSSKALSDGLKSVKPNLYDIKTLSQAIADKGWACLSKEGNFLSQTQAPTLYNDMVAKLDSAEQEPTFTSISGIQTAERLQPRDIVFYNGWYYYVQKGKNAIKRTQDWVTTETVTTSDFDYSNMVLCDDKLVFLGWNYLKVFNISTNELSDAIITTCHTGSESYSVIDRVLYFGSDNGWGYISLDDLDDFTNLENNLHIHDSTTGRPCFKCGNIWYSFALNLIKGNSFDSITESIDIVDRPLCSVKIDNYYLVFGGSGQDGNHNTYKVEENGTITKMRESDLSYPNCSKAVYYNGIIFVPGYSEGYYSTDLGVSWNTISEEQMGIDTTVVLANDFCAYVDRDGSITQIETTAKEYTDTFVINGNTVTINYAKTQDGTKIVTEFSQITPMQTIGNYLGYSNYFFLSQATGYEGVTLPYNSNLWTYMYIGDDYIESNLPNGNYIPFALKPLKITNISASNWVADNTYTDYDYKCDLSCPGVTANMFAQVIFAPTEADSGNYATVAQTGNNIITIYSKVNDTITIPNIVVMGV